MGRLYFLFPMALLAACAQDSEAAREAKFQKEMRAATVDARAQLPFFWERHDAPAQDEYDFRLKVAFPRIDGAKETEDLWVETLSREGATITAEYSSQPLYQGDKRERDVVAFEDRQIVDWAFFQGEQLLGHYTTRVSLPRLPQEQADALASMFGENPK